MQLPVGEQRPAHVVDVTVLDGVLDIMALGNVIELARALDQLQYSGMETTDEELDEMDAATTRYRLFVRWYSRRFAFIINDEWVSPSYIFRKGLIDYAATVLHYVREQEEDALTIDDEHVLSAAVMKKHLLKHISTHWRRLVGYWNIAEQSPSIFLSPDIPDIKIVTITDERIAQFKALGVVERAQYSGAPILDIDSQQAKAKPPVTPRQVTPPIASTSRAPILPSTPQQEIREISKRGPPSSPASPEKVTARPAKRRR
jgi:hypothetical protein